MKKLTTSFAVALMMFLSAGTAQAMRSGSGSGVLFDVNLYYGATKSETKYDSGSTTNNSDNKTAMYDIKMGLLMGSGIYIGGIYSSRSDNALNAAGTSGSAVGGSLGYVGSSGFFLIGHYLTNASRGEYKEGTGAQGDLGYMAGVGGSWLVGAEITYRSIGYKKNDSITNLDTYTYAETVPMLTLGYLF